MSQQTVIIMRHAEREDDAKGYQGPQLSDPEITPAGEQSTIAAAKAIAVHYKVSLVVASPFLRCVQTAKLAVQHFLPGAKVVFDNGLHEVNNQGKIKSDRPLSLTPIVASSVCNPPCPRWGENLQEATDRFVSAVSRIARAYPNDRTICLVTHGDAVSTIARLGLLGAASSSCSEDEVIVYNCDFNGWAAVRLSPGPARHTLRIGRAVGLEWTGVDIPKGGIPEPNSSEGQRSFPQPDVPRLVDEERLAIMRPMDSPRKIDCCGCVIV